MIEWYILERLRFIAGFVLFIAAIINLFGGALYTFTDETDKSITTTATAPADSSEETTPNNTVDGGAVSDARDPPESTFKDNLWRMVGFWFGVLLMCMFVSQIIGAVMLVLSRSKKFVMWVGILSILTESIGIYFFSFNLLRNGFGILAGVLAIVGSTLINEAHDATPSANAS